MKYVSLYIILALICLSCGSRKHSSQHIHAEQMSGVQTQGASQKIQREAIATIETKKSINTKLSEYIRITHYNDSGGVSSVQEEWRNTGCTELGVGRNRQDEFSISESSDSTTTNIQVTSQWQDSDQSDSDTSIIKGSDWFWIGIFVVVAAVLSVILIRIKRKN